MESQRSWVLNTAYFVVICHLHTGWAWTWRYIRCSDHFYYLPVTVAWFSPSRPQCFQGASGAVTALSGSEVPELKLSRRLLCIRLHVLFTIWDCKNAFTVFQANIGIRTCIKVVHYWLWLGCGEYHAVAYLICICFCACLACRLVSRYRVPSWRSPCCKVTKKKLTGKKPIGLRAAFFVAVIFRMMREDLGNGWPMTINDSFMARKRKEAFDNPKGKGKDGKGKKGKGKGKERPDMFVLRVCIVPSWYYLLSITPCHLGKWTCFCAELSWNWWYIDIDVRGQEGKEQGQERRLTLGWAMCTMTMSCRASLLRWAGLQVFVHMGYCNCIYWMEPISADGTEMNI